jgi:hypothetical protein
MEFNLPKQAQSIRLRPSGSRVIAAFGPGGITKASVSQGSNEILDECTHGYQSQKRDRFRFSATPTG